MKTNESGNYQKVVLENGLKVILVPLPHLKTITIQAAVKAGGRFENFEEAGLAHLLEHALLSNSIKTDPKSVNPIEAIGAEFGGHTSKETINFYIQALDQYAGEAMECICKTIFGFTLSEQVLEKEKRRVLEEMGTRRNDRILNEWDKWIWGEKQPLGKPLIGYPDTIRKITIDQLKTFFNKFYTPANTTIAVTGNFSKEDILNYINHQTDSLTIQQTNFPSQKTPVIFNNEKIKIYHNESLRTQIMFGFITGISFAHPDRLAMRILIQTLAGSNYSRLKKCLVFNNSLAYSFSGINWLFSDTGFSYIFANVAATNIKPCISNIVAEIQRIKTEGIFEDELKAIKEFEKTIIFSSLENSLATAKSLAVDETLQGYIQPPEELICALEKITADEVRQTAIKYLTKQNVKLLIDGNTENTFFADLSEIIEKLS